MNAALFIFVSLALFAITTVLGSSLFEAVGCFRDSGKNPRPLPTLIADLREDIDWYNINKTIDKCSQRAKQNGFQYFGIQFYGECWSGRQTETINYGKDGKSKKCVAGVGQAGANYVYKFVKKGTSSPVKEKSMFPNNDCSNGSQWVKTKNKFIEGEVISETSFVDQLSIASIKCKKQCEIMANQGCKAVRLYDLSIGLVYCTLFRTVTDYRCPHDSSDFSCHFANGESWEILG